MKLELSFFCLSCFFAFLFLISFFERSTSLKLEPLAVAQIPPIPRGLRPGQTQVGLGRGHGTYRSTFYKQTPSSF